MSDQLKPFHEVVVEKLKYALSQMSWAGGRSVTVSVLCEMIKESVVPNPAALAGHLEKLYNDYRKVDDSHQLYDVITYLRRRMIREAATSDSRS